MTSGAPYGAIMEAVYRVIIVRSFVACVVINAIAYLMAGR